MLSLCIGVMATTRPLSPTEAPIAITLIIAFALPCLWAISRAGYRATAAYVAVAAFAIAIENIALRTCLPYGCFDYFGSIGAKIGDVPWTVALSWPPLVFGAWALAQRFASGPQRLLLAVALLVAADLALDPGAVAQGLWRYQHPGLYYGVPFTNYIGWCVSGLVAMAIIQKFIKPKTKIGPGAIASYALILAFWTGIALAHGLIVPAAVGLALVSFSLRELLSGHTIYLYAHQQPRK